MVGQARKLALLSHNAADLGEVTGTKYSSSDLEE